MFTCGFNETFFPPIWIGSAVARFMVRHEPTSMALVFFFLWFFSLYSLSLLLSIHAFTGIMKSWTGQDGHQYYDKLIRKDGQFGAALSDMGPSMCSCYTAVSSANEGHHILMHICIVISCCKAVLFWYGKIHVYTLVSVQLIFPLHNCANSIPLRPIFTLTLWGSQRNG